MSGEIIVVEIVKHYRNGKANINKVLSTKDWVKNTDDLMKYVAESWGKSESSGQNRGYELEWKQITDPTLISEIINKEITHIVPRINNLQSWCTELRDYKTDIDKKIEVKTWKGWVGKEVVKHSNKPFKSTFKIGVVKDYTTNPNSGKEAFLMDDDSIVDCYIVKLKTNENHE